jgi:2-hydroxychromene-2-carboxylate isomerase
MTASSTAPLDVDLFWSFRSPYCYLATGRYVALARTYDLTVRLRPVLPVEMRERGFFERSSPLLIPYANRDLQRIAERYGIPFRWPDLDPADQRFAPPGAREDQPAIRHLARLGVEAQARGRGLDFADEISRLIWTGNVARWWEVDRLAECAARVGLDYADMDNTVRAEVAKFNAALEANAAALQNAGHWGTPTAVFDGEPFFGQDRVDLLVWRMLQAGLAMRPTVGPSKEDMPT